VSCLRLDLIGFIAVGCVLPTARPDWIHSSGLCLAYGYNSVLRLSVSH